MSVYKAIAAVQGELAKAGISKDRTNEQQHYKFRGIDDVYAALSPVLSKHGLCLLPRVLSRTSEERKTKDDKRLNYVTVEVEFDLVAAEDGSSHTIKTFGEAMDSADKATNKAMSAAYKYAAFQAFCIPCEGEDADSTTHEVAPKGARLDGPTNLGTLPPKVNLGDAPKCPKCGGPMWDNRGKKTNPVAPDFKCKDKANCDGVIWPPKEHKPAPKIREPGKDDFPPFDPNDDLPEGF